MPLLLMVPLLLLASQSAAAQTGAEPTHEQLTAKFQAHQSDFDYLLGDWAFSSDSKEYGKGQGLWSAFRLPEGQILDEYRVMGDSAETWYQSITLRAYNARLDRWELLSSEQVSGLQDTGTAQRVGNEMHIEQQFGVSTDKPARWRIRYYNIAPDRFSWTATVSLDGGKTWTPDFVRIEARRIGPPRSLGPLTRIERKQ